MKGPSIFFIVGPSAVGKSEIAYILAERLKAEIICCDALQVYKEINIASAKPSSHQRALVPHHLFDIVSVTEEFNVARWRKMALESIEDIRGRGKSAVIVGGSGMYMTMLLDGIFEGAAGDEDLREDLAQELVSKGPLALHQRLQSLDPQAASKIHPNDPQRILRALEVILSTGDPLSHLQPKREGIWGKMPITLFALNRPREELYARVEARVEDMFKTGLVDEIKAIADLPLSRTAQKLIGIPEVFGFLKGEYDLERAKYLMKLHTRHYVKRQLTWFRRDKRLKWIDIAINQTAVEIVDAILKI